MKKWQNKEQRKKERAKKGEKRKMALGSKEQHEKKRR